MCHNVLMNKIVLWFLTLSWASLTFYLTTIPNFHPSNDTFVSWLLSNGGHFFFFGILALLIPLTYSLSLSLTSLYGLLIELAQRGIPGRSFSLVDFSLDTLGAVAFLFIYKKLQSKL